MMDGKSPLERVNFEIGGSARLSRRLRRPTREYVPNDELLGVLSNDRRRRLVTYLHREDNPVSLSDAVAHVFEVESDAGRKTESYAERTAAVATDLRHVHLPKLTDADVVRHDRDADALEAGSNADRAVRLLEAVTDGFAPSDGQQSDDHRTNPLVETCSDDAAFRLLADETRRFVLSHLDGSDDRVRLADLAERVAAWEAGKPVAEVTEDERETAEIELHHKHLPMLADAGILEYDRETRTLPERGHPVAVAEWLNGSTTFQPTEMAERV